MVFRFVTELAGGENVGQRARPGPEALQCLRIYGAGGTSEGIKRKMCP